MTLGEKIQILRKQNGLSQEALAEKLAVTRQTVSKWELNRSMPDLDFIARLSELFHVSADYLIKDEMTAPDKPPVQKKAFRFTEKTKHTLLTAVSALELTSVLVCLVCDYFTAGSLSWSLIAIAAMAAGWFVLLPVLTAKEKVIFKTLLAASTVPFPLLAVLALLLKSAIVFTLGSCISLVCIAAVWGIYNIFRKKPRPSLACSGLCPAGDPAGACYHYISCRPFSAAGTNRLDLHAVQQRDHGDFVAGMFWRGLSAPQKTGGTMKTVLLHGLGQTAKDWAAIAEQLSSDADCPELFALAQSGLSYPQILAGLEKRYADTAEPLRICGLSLGGMLALDYAIRHGEKVDSLILIGIQCKVSRLLVDFQNLLFRWMPDKAFADTGLSKRNTINLAHSMRELDFTGKLQEVKCPVTLLCGEKDRPNRAAAKQLKKLLPQAELLIVPGAGHEVNQDAPEVIVELLSR